MATDLAAGFCDFISKQQSFSATTLPPTSLNVGDPSRSQCLSQAWLFPQLQIIDIQRNVTTARSTTSSSAPPAVSIIYVALSDGTAVVWGILPPNSPLEALALNNELDVGSCVTLHDFGTLRARNGQNVLVLLEVSIEATIQVSLIGEPQIPDGFNLSSRALRRATNLFGPGGIGQQDTSKHSFVSLADLWQDAAEWHDVPWGVVVRVLWKSKLRKAISAGPRESASSSSMSMLERGEATNHKGKFVFDVTVVDGSGNGVTCVFMGNRSLHGLFQQGDVISLCDGSIRCRGDSSPESLFFNDRSIIINCGSGSEAGDLPHTISKDLSETHLRFADVTAAHRAEVGEVISVKGVVLKSSAVIPTSTSRGTVERKELVLSDCATKDTIQMTLWEPHAQIEPTLNTIWCFGHVAVKMFRSSRILSTRNSSEIFPLPSLIGGAGIVEQLVVTQYPSSSSGTNLGSTQHPPQLGSSCAPKTTPPLFLLKDVAAATHELHPVASRAGASSVAAMAAQIPKARLTIARVKLPLFYQACIVCGRRSSGTCPQCGGSRSELRFILSLKLSDSIETVWATGFTPMLCQRLFGETTQELLSKGADYHRQMAELMIGVPVLAQVTSVNNSSTSGDAQLVDLQHVDTVEVCRWMLREIGRFP